MKGTIRLFSYSLFQTLDFFYKYLGKDRHLKKTRAHFQVNSVLEEQLVYQVIFLSYFSFPPNKLEGNIGQ